MPYLTTEKLQKLKIIKKQEIEPKNRQTTIAEQIEQETIVDSSELAKFGQDFNPVSFLNIFAQQFKIRNRPLYTFTSFNSNSKFICSLEFYNQHWVSRVEKKSKQRAKENVARLAIIDLNAQTPEKCKQINDIMRTAEALKPKRKNFGLGVRQMAKDLHPSDLCSRVVVWYNEQQKHIPPKPARVLILELCQMYCLGQPKYEEMNVSPGLHFFSITIGNDMWHSNSGFRFKPDAKDHVANRAFNDLYEKIRKRETEEINVKVLKYKIRTGQVIGNLDELNKKTNVNSEIEDINKTRFVSSAYPYPPICPPIYPKALNMYPPTTPEGTGYYRGLVQQGEIYEGPIRSMKFRRRGFRFRRRIRFRPKKNPITMLYERSAQYRWTRPRYFFYNHESGYSAEVYVNGKPYCTGRVYQSKEDAKVDVSQFACNLLWLL